MHVPARRFLALLAAILASLSIAVPGPAAGSDPEGQIAVYEGDLVDLSVSWEQAEACLVTDGGVAECFDSEAELDLRIAELDASEGRAAALDGFAAAASNTVCSTSLRLYDGAGYTGSVLALRGRAMWVNLTSHGFSNRTSSFKMGSCNGIFADLNNGGGSWYPEASTKANKSVSTMVSGWDNRVSSILLR